MDKELLNTIKANREDWAMKRYNKHETELGLEEMKALDAEWPGWGLVEARPGRMLEVSLGGTRVRDAINKSELKISYSKKDDCKKFYPLTNIYDSKTTITIPLTVHRLVANAFCPNDDPEHKTDVNHINGDKWNNAYWNLEWCTHSENQKLAFETGLHKVQVGEEAGASKYTNEQVRQVCQLLQDRPDMTFKEIAKITGVRWTAVRLLYQKGSWKHITSEYNFPPRATRARGETIASSVYNNDQVEQVCQLLNDNYLGKSSYIRQQIADKTGMSKDIVDKIATGKNWVHVASKYDWYKAKFGDQAKQGTNNS